jgi:ABC-2 type transport system ATP-binding protein
VVARWRGSHVLETILLRNDGQVNRVTNEVSADGSTLTTTTSGTLGEHVMVCESQVRQRMKPPIETSMLDVRRLTKRYSALTAIQDLSFEVHQGEVLGLLGPNGSGKSTTVKILSGLLRPTNGSVRLDGADILADLPAYKAMLGYVPEEPHLYSYLTAPEYLRLVGGLRRLPQATLEGRIDQFLRLLDIYDERYQTLSSYSKGMKQKVLIAAAMLHNPPIVVLDEPFSGLDVSAARVLKAFVRGLAAEGKTIVFSSHVLEVVEQVCSRVVILKDGRVVGHDSVDHLRATLELPSLDAVFAALVAEDNVDDRSRQLLAAMKA